jgi:hypothetical protein
MGKYFPFRPATDTTSADWITTKLRQFDGTVLSIVPEGFPAYARVYHPARNVVNSTQKPVRWAEVAQANNRCVHRQMQWYNIAGYSPYTPGPEPAHPGLWSEPPEEGSLPPDVARLLAQVLAPHTTTPEKCWFGIWEGFSGLHPTVLRSPAFLLPLDRDMRLLWADLQAIDVSFANPPMAPFPDHRHLSANLVWPDDRAWVIATEIDFMTTYVAGNEDAIASVTTSPDLEVDQIAPTDGITWDSDTLNPKPK